MRGSPEKSRESSTRKETRVRADSRVISQLAGGLAHMLLQPRAGKGYITPTFEKAVGFGTIM